MLVTGNRGSVGAVGIPKQKSGHLMGGDGASRDSNSGDAFVIGAGVRAGLSRSNVAAELGEDAFPTIQVTGGATQ